MTNIKKPRYNEGGAVKAGALASEAAKLLTGLSPIELIKIIKILKPKPKAKGGLVKKK